MIAMIVAALASTPDLGVAAGMCHSDQQESHVLVEAVGLKDRSGRLKLELYPANNRDFLADDNVLVSAGKSFARVEVPVPASGQIVLCIRAPAPGRYALVLMHDRNANRRFDFRTDGIGFPGNPKLGWSKPSANAASLTIGPDEGVVRIVMNYLNGFAMRPIR